MLRRSEFCTGPRTACNCWRWSVCIQISSLHAAHFLSTDTGAQPLVSEDGKIILAVNGEIYNHIALRASVGSGVKFKTHSDCEVIIPLVTFFLKYIVLFFIGLVSET